MLRQACQRLPSLCQSSIAFQYRGVKESTYLTGLDVDPAADKHTPLALQELMEHVGEVIPAGVEYRKHVESYCTRFLKVIADSSSQGDAEQYLGRQYEQILEDVESEMAVIRTMTEWKPWEVQGAPAPKLFAEYKNIPENVRKFREFQHDLGSK